MTGYNSKEYAESLCMGPCLHLDGADGWLIKRRIELDYSDDGYDLVGPYPLFLCRDWGRLGDDLTDLAKVDTIPSISLVTDPFLDISEIQLKRMGWYKFTRYKEHFVTDLSQKPKTFLAKHHRRYIKRAASQVDVELVEKPIGLATAWIDLYQKLIERHSITGPARFSDEALKRQLQLPGMVALVARYAQELVGMVLWYLHEGIAYYHLGAYSDLGYQLRASYAIFDCSINLFRHQADYLALGAGAGATADANDGLTRFKKGWSTGTRTVYFCGRILDHDAYKFLCESCGYRLDKDFFPAYRYAITDGLGIVSS